MLGEIFIMRRNVLAVLLLVAVTLALFWRVTGFEFVNYDDTDYITRNPHVQAGLTGPGVAWAFGQIHGEATYWHPLTWLSHMLDCQLFGLKAGGHHLTNLLLHTANVALLFLLLNAMTGAYWQSFVVAALFAWHPLQVETVSWVAERKNVLSTLFWMLTLLAYVRYAAKPGMGRYVPVALLFALGLMAKPMLVTLPCVLLLLDWWPLRRCSFSPAKTLREGDVIFAGASTPRLLGEKLPLFALAVLIGVVTILAHRGLGMTSFAYGVNLEMRIENAIVSYVRYLGKTLWPAHLSVLYLHPGKWPSWQVGVCLFVLIVASGLILREARRFPYLAVGWLWFLGTLVPVIGLIQVGVQAMANRFAYVPMIGLLWMGVWGVAELISRWPNRQVLSRVVAALILLACLSVSSWQLRYWRNSVTLFEHALAIAPDNFVAHNNLAYSLALAGQFEPALEHARKAVELRRDFPEARYQVGVLLDAKHQTADAIPYYAEAIRLDPNWALPRLGLARALSQTGKPDEAMTQYAEVVRITPGSAEAHAELAVVLAQRQQTSEAVFHYREALRLKPDSPEVLNNLAWLRATHPRLEFRDGAEAVRLAQKACALTQSKQPLFIGTLAAAYAEAGRFADAVNVARAARDAAREANNQELADKNEKLIELYRAEKPYHETTP
jgi:Flp pilus assembly protein TadD